MKKVISCLKGIGLISLICLMTACSSTLQPTVELDTNYFSGEKMKVGVLYIAPIDKATTHITGASCLLCYAVASALTSELDTHLENTLSNDELVKIKELVVSEYKELSKDTKLITLDQPIKELKDFKGELGFAKKDFRSLKESLAIDLLVVLELPRHGAFRSFSNYIPNGDPQGYIAGLLYSVDLSTNAYVQYLDLTEMVQQTGEWDEPPSFPSVTTAYYQAAENLKKKIRDSI